MLTIVSFITLGLVALVLITQRTIHMDLTAATAALTEANDRLTQVDAVLTKVSGETTMLLDKIQALTDAAGNVQTTPEFDAALSAVQAQVDAVGAAASGIDAQVPDADTPPAEG